MLTERELMTESTTHDTPFKSMTADHNSKDIFHQGIGKQRYDKHLLQPTPRMRLPPLQKLDRPRMW